MESKKVAKKSLLATFFIQNLMFLLFFYVVKNFSL